MANVKSKKVPGKPSPPPNRDTGVVSFGKLFLHFVAPELAKKLSAGSRSPANFELQVIFYSMNNSCGPMGKNAKYNSGADKYYSIAEFPIDLEVFRAAFDSKIRATNTSSMTAEEFLLLAIESQFMDVRAIGYGRKSLYKSWQKDKPALEPLEGKDAQATAEKWSNQYGDMKLPMIEMFIDPELISPDGKSIRRIHVYDRQSVPYNEMEWGISRENQKLLLEKGVPVLTPGTNGSLIINSTIASKTDGTQGSIYLLRAMSTNDKSGNAQISNNGLVEEGNLPLRTLPVQMTLTTFGVPKARLYQTYFVDFNTGTTLDNLYVCTQIQHNITPGKFTTNWTFAYTNGYGKFSNKPNSPSTTPDQSGTPTGAKVAVKSS